jgi:hypothetical protein
MARRLGVMYIGWNNRIWSSYNPVWRDLKGCTTDPRKAARAYDTTCHRNHVHLSLSWDGAMGLTSFWSGLAVPEACRAPWGSSDTLAGVGVGYVPVTPVRVLDTRQGTGVDAPCRLTAGSSWDPSGHDVVVRVTGIGEVPADGVAAVALRVTESRASGLSSTLSVRSTGTSPSTPIIAPASVLSQESTVVVPVAADGTVRLRTDRGGADLSADVVGYAPLAAPPDPTPPDPTPPDPAPSSPPSTPRDSLTATRPAVVLDTTIPAATTVSVPLAGVGPIPATDVTGVALSVTVRRTARPALVGLLAPAGPGYAAIVRTSTATSRSAQALVPTSTTVAVRNSGTVAVSVRLVVSGWSTSSAPAGSTRLTVLASRQRVVDSIRGAGLAGAAPSSAARVLAVTGPGHPVPAGATAVLVGVAARGTVEGTLSLGSLAWAPAVSFTPGRWAYDTVLVPLATAGTLSVAAPAGTQVRLDVVGYVDGS